MTVHVEEVLACDWLAKPRLLSRQVYVDFSPCGPPYTSHALSPSTPGLSLTVVFRVWPCRSSGFNFGQARKDRRRLLSFPRRLGHLLHLEASCKHEETRYLVGSTMTRCPHTALHQVVELREKIQRSGRAAAPTKVPSCLSGATTKLRSD